MKVLTFFWFSLTLTANCFNCSAPASPQPSAPATAPKEVSETAAEVGNELTEPRPAAANYPAYAADLQGKRLGLIVNQTSRVGEQHLVDFLLERGHEIVRIFAPEHGFRGGADAGAKVVDGKDGDTGLPIKSLYGRAKKPSEADLADIDLLVFDIQDVGVRFYTYISTLHYAMESAARFGTPVLVLDRPNPNGHYVDGPVRQPGFESFVGVDPIPVVHGLTVGEYARMVNGEGWLGEGLRCELTVVPCTGWTHDTPYELPIAPSPNLPNQRSIYLYPGLCFFEGTVVSVGRGTLKQFQQYGHPLLPYGEARFTPTPGPGSANPKLQGQACRGVDFTGTPAENFRQPPRLDLGPLLAAYRGLSSVESLEFFDRADFFDKLAGTDRLRLDMLAGKPEAEIRAGWEAELRAFRELREGYLLYR